MNAEEARRRFERLALPHLDAAYNLARWLTRDEHDAHDVVQEAFVRALRYVVGFRGDNARGWLLQIVRNTAFTWLKENRSSQDVALDDDQANPADAIAAPSADEPEASALRNADRARINRAIAALPIAYREVLVLRELEDCSYNDIARIVDVPIGTVMSRLARARALMRIALSADTRRVARGVKAGESMKSEADHQDVHAFVDDELELSRRLAIEQRIAHDPATQREVEHLRQLRAAVRDKADYHVAPDALRNRIAALAAIEDPARATRASRGAASWRGWRPLSAALALALLATIGVQLVISRDGEGRVRDDLVASHVRATIGGRLVDIASSDHHTVKPWLSARLDYSPPVRDGDLGGMAFLGGRIDYLDGRPVAALVYRKGGHVVDTFVWPTKDGDRAVGYTSDRGFQIAHWSKAGMTWWAISDVGRSEFGDFIDAIRADGPTP